MPSALLPTIKLVSAKQVPVFRLGKQTDSNGIEKVWSPAELDEAIAAYNEVAAKADHEAPVLHGHRGKHAFGWIEKAYRVGETVFCDLKNVVESFAQNVNSKLHPKRSISFYPPNHPNNPTPGRLNINHLAYLPAEGEVNPAVKGLPDHAFSDAELDACIEYEFADYNFGAWIGGSPLEAVANLFQSLRDRTIEDDDLETADKLFPVMAIDAIKASANQQWASVDMVLNVVRPLQDQIDRLTYPEPKPEYAEMNLKAMAKDKGVTAVKGISPVDLPKILAGDLEPDDEQMSAIASAMGIGKDALKKMMTGGKTKATDMSEQQTEQVSQADFAELTNTVQTLQAELAATRNQATATAEENRVLKAERENDRIASFVEKLVSDRKLRSTEKDAVIQELKWLPNDNPVEFSEGGATVSKTPRQAKMDRLAASAELYSVRNMPTGPEFDPTQFSEQQQAYGLDVDVDVASIKQDRLIRAKQAEMVKQTGAIVSYAEAANALVQTGVLSL
jgi:hypothetical protein